LKIINHTIENLNNWENWETQH